MEKQHGTHLARAGGPVSHLGLSFPCHPLVVVFVFCGQADSDRGSFQTNVNHLKPCVTAKGD